MGPLITKYDGAVHFHEITPTTTTHRYNAPTPQMYAELVEPAFIETDSYLMFRLAQEKKDIDVAFRYVDWLDKEYGLFEAKTSELERIMTFVMKRQSVLISIDVEASERNGKEITEIGISLYNPENQQGSLVPFIQSAHIIILENQHMRNKKFMPDHVDFFNGGESLIMSKKDAKEAISLVFNDYPNPCLVGHDVSGDIKWLKDMGVFLPYYTIDTQVLLAITHGKRGASLKNGLRILRQPFAFLHNAGNDAYYTMLLCLCLCDSFYRVASQVDSEETMHNFATQPSTKNEPPNKSKKSRSDPSGIFKFLKRWELP
ncbi:hypothetical protein FT663_03653 [Candidozyma haemuli var. vulneris]|nr:hypothetical protein FT662_04939 [[Candida] haemuloni var. vulneris]KAF3989377.1 hypothetical protein FT663_03653 [[Candida] haemuloni var. vulneris]